LPRVVVTPAILKLKIFGENDEDEFSKKTKKSSHGAYYQVLCMMHDG